jgi:hypothetical protein
MCFQWINDLFGCLISIAPQEKLALVQQLVRVPARWNHLIDKNARKIRL